MHSAHAYSNAVASRLLEAMEKVPISWSEEGVWFNDWGRALDMADAPRPRNIEELAALSDDDRKRFFQATEGIAPGPDARDSIRNYVIEVEENLGFNPWQIDLAVAPGWSYSWSPHPAYMEGMFNASAIRQNLLDLEYEERQIAGDAYYAIRDDYRSDLHAPPFLRTNTFNRIYIDDGTLVATPATEQIQSIMRTWTGEQQSLLEAPGFLRLGETLWDTLSAAILPRSVALDTSHISEQQQPQFKKQDTWGTLHEWESAGFGFGRDADGEKWYVISLFYPDPDAAGADASELVHRMETYEASVWPELLQQGYPKHPFVGCEITSTSHASYLDGSVLTVRYRAPGATIPHGDGTHPVIWFELIDMRDLGFLVP